jgi:hypothetical protein
MISEKHECIFVHIPKTAGKSIETVFLDLQGLTWKSRAPLLLRPNSDPAKGPERLAHLKAREYVQCGYVGQADFDRFFKFSFVRNPWSRLVSEYNYRRLEREMTFRAFVANSFQERDEYRDASRHTHPQIEFVTDDRGEIIVDFIGRFETLDEDFREVSRRLGLGDVVLRHREHSISPGAFSHLRRLLTGRSPQPKKNSRPYQEYYDEDLRVRVGDYYAQDVETFGYSFEGFAASKPSLPRMSHSNG